MKWYITRRLVLILPTVFIVSVLVFSVVRLIPGDVVELMVSEQGFADDVEELRSMLGLDKPVHIQYLQYIGDIFLKGDFGVSLWSGEPVRDEMMRRLPVSIQLGSLALFFTLLLGIPVAVWGVLNYLGVAALWTGQRFLAGRRADLSQIGLLGLLIFGTLFSIYLTCLELFAIHAICMWCLGSAVTTTALMLMVLIPTTHSAPKVPKAS